MKVVLGFLCVVLVAGGVLSAHIAKRDAKTKPDDEDVYGDLEEGSEPDLQKDQDYYTDEAIDPAPEYPAEEDGDSTISSKPEVFVRNISDVVVLPCAVSSKAEPVRVWIKEGVTLFQDTIKVQAKDNLEIKDGSLIVKILGDNDFGNYTCKLALSENLMPEIVHTIARPTSPKIVALFMNNNRTSALSIGETLTLTCRATGYPKPAISWHKNNERLGTEGETLTIQNVRAKHAGSYRCLADNKVGHPAHEHIDVVVNHAPIVSLEKYLVNSDHESDAELVCEVKASPMAVVNWQKDGENLATKEPKISLTRERNNERNILIIKNISEKDFGKYSCVASNALGKQMREVTLVKTPAIAKFEKLTGNDNSKEVILQWRVESRQPITMHELQYRRKGDSNWETINPEVANSDNDVYLIKHTLKNLEAGIYETRARSKNNHGWSEYSDIMPFEEAKHGSHHPKHKHNKKEMKEIKTPVSTQHTPAQQRSEEISSLGESTSSSMPLLSSIFLVTLTLFATLYHTRQ